IRRPVYTKKARPAVTVPGYVGRRRAETGGYLLQGRGSEGGKDVAIREANTTCSSFPDGPLLPRWTSRGTRSTPEFGCCRLARCGVPSKHGQGDPRHRRTGLDDLRPDRCVAGARRRGTRRQPLPVDPGHPAAPRGRRAALAVLRSAARGRPALPRTRRRSRLPARDAAVTQTPE